MKIPYDYNNRKIIHVVPAIILFLKDPISASPLEMSYTVNIEIMHQRILKRKPDITRFLPILTMSVLQQERNYGTIRNMQHVSVVKQHPPKVRKVIQGRSPMTVPNLERSSLRNHCSKYI